MTLEECEYKKLCSIYDKYFYLGYLNVKLESKLALIALICNITYRLNKKKGPLEKRVSCYDVICKIGGDEELKKNFYKSLGAVCDSLTYGCEEFPDFGIAPKDMPKTVKQLLESYVPF